MPKTKKVRSPKADCPQVKITFAYEAGHWRFDHIHPKKHEDSFYKQWAENSFYEQWAKMWGHSYIKRDLE